MLTHEEYVELFVLIWGSDSLSSEDMWELDATLMHMHNRHEA